MKHLRRQILMFGLVGLESTILNYFVFLFTYQYFNLNYLLAASLGFIAGVLFGYYFNKKLTFESRLKTSQSFSRYLIIYALSLAVNIMLLNILVEKLGLDPIVANAALIIPIVILNFIGSKIVAFENLKW